MRSLAAWILIGAGLVLALGGLATLAAGAPALGEVWYATARGSLNLLQAITQRYLHPFLWDPVMLGLLLRPAWLVGLLAGVIVAMPGVWLLRRR